MSTPASLPAARVHVTEAMADPVAFWAEQAAQLPWLKAPEQTLSRDANGTYRWFAGGETNTCWLAVDRHVADGRGDQDALIYDSPATGVTQRLTFRALQDAVARFAGGLRELGVEAGDRVIIYMPMMPETVIAMLACARLGAVHSVVFGGFASPELAVRIDDCQPKVLLTATCGIEFDRVIPYLPLVEGALALAGSQPDHCVVLQRDQCPAELVSGRDVDWQTLAAKSAPADYVPVAATDPLYILYTSGTTGKPKGVVRDNGGHAVALHYSMKAVYDSDVGDVFWAASDVGWVVGHSYIVYGPLIRGCTTIVFEGKPVRTPDAGTFWRVIADHSVKTFFTAPTAFRAIKKEDPEAKHLARYDVSCLKHVFLAGERLDPPTYHWLDDLLHVPVIDHWWMTETGWPICANLAGVGLLPTKPGSLTLPVPTYDLQIVDDDGEPVAAGEEGNVVIAEPMPPGALYTVWGDHQRFVDAYWSRFPGKFLSGDGGFVDADGYVYIMGRIDDVINVAGHRLSTGELEETVASHPAVAECAVVGAADADKGQVPVGLVLLKDGINIDPAVLRDDLVQMVRQQVGAFANFRRAVIVARLPKTRSGKILRKVIRKIIDGEPYEAPSTIDDPAILTEIEVALRD